MPCPKIIALDMDGTLLNEHGRIPDAFWELLRLADDREVLVTPASGRQLAKYYHANTNVDSLVDVPFEQPVKVALYVDGDAERDALAWVQAHAPGLHHVVSGQHWIDIMSPEADKGKALLAIADALGVPQEATAAIGDFLNDYTMLQAAGTAVAMGNAHPDLKTVADEVIGTNAEHAAVHRLAAWLSEQ